MPDGAETKDAPAPSSADALAKAAGVEREEVRPGPSGMQMVR